MRRLGANSTHFLRRIGLAFIILACSTFLNAAEPPPVKLAATPRVQFEPGEVKFTVTVEPHEDTREVCLVVVESGFETFSCHDAEGLSEPRTSWIEQTLPAGEYHAYVKVTRQGAPKSLLSNAVLFEIRGDAP